MAILSLHPSAPMRAVMNPRLAHIDCWIFDLDNTLYPPSTGLFDLIDARMGAFIARLVGCDLVEARRVQKQYFHDHGTTLAGLVAHHGIEPEEFLVDVHAIDLDRLAPCLRLRSALAALPGRRLIFTNADADYAARILEARGIADLFGDICDIRATRYVPKPQTSAYADMLNHLGVDPARSLFVEDMARNLGPAKALGMTTVWLDNGSESGHRDHDPKAVDFRAVELTDWLEQIQESTGTL